MNAKITPRFYRASEMPDDGTGSPETPAERAEVSRADIEGHKLALCLLWLIAFYAVAGVGVWQLVRLFSAP